MPYQNISFTDLIGKTFKRVYIPENDYRDEMIFECDDGTAYMFYHYQDCCESVSIEDITGDLHDLEEAPLLVAEERSEGYENEDRYGDGGTWTFYTFRTIKGTVDVRWLGMSNGYYSESVDFKQIR